MTSDKKVVELRWPTDGVTKPDDVIGKSVKLKFEEHEYRKEFVATIEGFRRQEQVPDEVLYVLKLTPDKAAVIGSDHLLFRPESVTFDSRFSRELDRGLRKGQRYQYRASVEEMLLNPNARIRSLMGRVFKFRNLGGLPKDTFAVEDLFVLAIGHMSRQKAATERSTQFRSPGHT